MKDNLLTWFTKYIQEKKTLTDEKIITGSLKSEFIKQWCIANPKTPCSIPESEWSVWEVKEGDYGYSSSIVVNGKRLYGEW